MKKEKTPNIVSLAILTLITSVIWIFFSLYRIFTEKSDVKVSEEIIRPLSPILDEKIISEIENKVFIDQNQIPESIITKEIETEEKEEEENVIEETEEQTEQVQVDQELDNEENDTDTWENLEEI